MTDHLDEAMLLLAVGHLTRRDERLAAVVRQGDFMLRVAWLPGN